MALVVVLLVVDLVEAVVWVEVEAVVWVVVEDLGIYEHLRNQVKGNCKNVYCIDIPPRDLV